MVLYPSDNTNNVWEDIKNKLNIVDVINQYVPVKKISGSYKAVCPFHNDKNPSLTISPIKGLWHCFGCGAGGDIFKFVMDIENLDKKDALKILAKKAGVELKAITPLSPEKLQEKKLQLTRYQKGLQYLDWASDVYHKILLKILENKDNPITQYCRKRGLSLATINKFRLGYAPKGEVKSRFMLSLCQKHHLDLDLMLETGLIKTNQDNVLRDSFVDRLMVPIQNLIGEVVGFTGRILPYENNKNRPKYLNSGQSQWFDKSSIWFGYYQHQEHIKKEKLAIVVEGNMDVIACNQAGLEVVLASQGTSFSSQQLNLLKKITSNVVLAFDNDAAGQASGYKFYLEARREGLIVNKLIIPSQYKDIDEWLKAELERNGQDAARFINNFNIIPFLDYQLQTQHAKLTGDNLVEQTEVIDQFLRLLIVENQLNRQHYLQKLAKISGFAKPILEDELNKKIQISEQEKKHQLRFNNTAIAATNALEKEQQTENNLTSTLKLGPSQNELIISTFQLLASIYLFKTRQGELINFRLDFVYDLLKPIIHGLIEPDFTSYLKNNQDLLSYIFEQQVSNFSQKEIQTKFEAGLVSILAFIDNKVRQGLLPLDLINKYTQVKQSGIETTIPRHY